jgi:GntR family transcriptional regulator
MVRRTPTLARQAALEIVAGIRSGTLGDKDGLMPSEAILSQQLGVSRATLREALSQLEQSGLIVRWHGIGTFLTPGHPLMQAGLEELESLETLAERIGVEIHMGECRIEERTATPVEAEFLMLEEGSPVLAVERVIVSGDLPIAYLIDVLPADTLDPRVLRDEFHGSVLDLLLRRPDRPLGHSRTELSAVAADDDLTRWLSIGVGDPLLKLTAQLFAKDGSVVDHSLSYFSPGHFRFHVNRRVNQLTVLE